jgi:hypothetical protein
MLVNDRREEGPYSELLPRAREVVAEDSVCRECARQDLARCADLSTWYWPDLDVHVSLV